MTGKWTDLAKKIKYLNEEKPLSKMYGEHLKVHCKNDNDFRKTQSFIDINAVAYTTLSHNKNSLENFVSEKSPHPLQYADPHIIIK